jgi:SulP family sulfate permease
MTPDAPAGRERSAVGPGQALRQVMAAVTAGSIGGLLTLSAAIAYPAVIFTGSLAGHLGLGITAALFTSMVLGAVVACLSTYPAAIAQAQIETAVVLGAVAVVITETLDTALQGVQVATMLAVIAVATASLGLCFVVLGAFRLGNVVRYIPFPVIFGFLGYIAWLLAKGGIATVVGYELELANATQLLHPEALWRWLPPVLLALGLLALQLRRRHFFNLPAALLLALSGFWLIAWLGGATPATLLDSGHVLEPLAPGQGWSPLRLPAALASVEWSVVRAALPQIAIVSFVATITLLLTASTLEVATRRPVDLNRELTVTGMGNLLAALGGGLPGYHSVSASLLPHYLGTRSRLVGLIGALFCAGMLLFGGSLLAFVPKLLIGLVLLYLAFDIVAELVLDRWPLIGPGERAVTVLVLAALIGIGFVEGILIGCAGGLVVFAVNYARTGVVRAEGSGLAYASNVVRPADQVALLEELASAIHVVRLQGFLFFGTAHRLLDEIGAELAAPRAVPLRFLVLDFGRVTGADASAIASFARLLGEAESRGFRIVLAAVPPTVAGLIKAVRGGDKLAIFADLDHCLEHAENALLAAAVPPDGPDGGRGGGRARCGARRSAAASPAARLCAAGHLATRRDRHRPGRAIRWPLLHRGGPADRPAGPGTGRHRARADAAAGHGGRRDRLLPGPAAHPHPDRREHRCGLHARSGCARPDARGGAGSRRRLPLPDGSGHRVAAGLAHPLSGAPRSVSSPGAMSSPSSSARPIGSGAAKKQVIGPPAYSSSRGSSKLPLPRICASSLRVSGLSGNRAR